MFSKQQALTLPIPNTQSLQDKYQYNILNILHILLGLRFQPFTLEGVGRMWRVMEPAPPAVATEFCPSMAAFA
jgi:hypothetical protein